MVHYIRLFPSGNSSEFSAIDTNLRELGVNFETYDLQSGARMYRLPERELTKLPQDEDTKESYLPVSPKEGGHSLYVERDDATWKIFLQDNKNSRERKQSLTK